MYSPRSFIKKAIIALALLAGIFSCKKPLEKEVNSTNITALREVYSSGDYTHWPEPELDSLVDKITFTDIGPLPKVAYPESNPFSKEKELLGKLLFFDPRLSSSKQIACASCHSPELGWTDNTRRSFGHDRRTGARNAMTILNTAFAEKLFWDGRANSLEHQSIFPIQDELEMNNALPDAVKNIQEIDGYKPYFNAAFGSDEITTDRIQKALATFERSIVSSKSRFDLFVEGDSTKLNNKEVMGLHLFRTKARCINCHNTPYFSDNGFHNDGQTLWGSKEEDLGLYNITGNVDDVGKFKTPTLREVTRTGPWMHHGNFPTMRDVTQFYNLGNPAPIQDKYRGTARDSILPKTSPILKKLNLSVEELEALEAFIASLSTTPRRMAPPKLPQ